MYSNTASVFGFHGLDKKIGIDVINNRRQLNQSENTYDWLGEGIYFWENNHERAMQWAEQSSKRKGSKIEMPFVIGAVIDLGLCFDLLDQKWLDFLGTTYEKLKRESDALGKELPVNGKFIEHDFDFKKRELDCAVIRYAKKLAAKSNIRFDTVRAAFWEGDELYPNAGFKKYNHIQIAVINPDCIKAIFLPR